MIILNNKRNVIKSNYNNKSSEFTIDDKSKPFFMQLMRSGIYTKKEQAVVREYVTNAFDEHIAHNVDRPVTIHVPTFDKPELWIRDYAKGLSDDDIRNIYISYGNSTKRNTNDLTGCMGIGCKAGFALDSKQFNIVSIHQDSPDNRVKRTYCAYLDDDDVGKIDLLSAEPTNEPTGICIKIGVSQRHINVFNSEINRIYNSAINKPELINITNNNEHVAKEYEVLHVNDNLQYTKYGRHIDALEACAHARMGNIDYPIDYATIERRNPNLDPGVACLLRERSIIVRFDIGTLNIAASREGLQYDNNTVQTIVTRFQAIAKHITSKCINDLNNTPCLYQRIRKSMSYKKQLPDSLHVYALNQIKPEYKQSHPLNHANYHVPSSEKNEWYMYKYSIENYNDKFTCEKDRTNITDLQSDMNRILFYDTNKAENPIAINSVVRRVKYLMQEESGTTYVDSSLKVYVIHYSSVNTNKESLMETLGLDEFKTFEFINVQDIPVLESNRSNDSNNSTAHVDLFKFNRNGWGVSEQWRDAGNVSICASNPVLYLNLSGYHALRTPMRDIKNNDPQIHKAQLDKQPIQDMLYFMQQNSDLLTQQQRDVFTTIISKQRKVHIETEQQRNDNFNIQDYCLNQIPDVELYGSRKKNWSLLDDNVNAYNLYNIYEHVLTLYAQKHADTLYVIDTINTQLNAKSKFLHDYNQVSLCKRHDNYGSSARFSISNLFDSLSHQVVRNAKLDVPNDTILNFISKHGKSTKLWSDFYDIAQIGNGDRPGQDKYETNIRYLHDADLFHVVTNQKLERKYSANHVTNVLSKVLQKYPILMTISSLFDFLNCYRDLHCSYSLALGYVHDDMTEDDIEKDTIAFSKMQLTQLIQTIKSIFK